MSIVEFFDPCNIDHLRAWHHLCKYGCWPAWFVPEGTTFDHVWQVSIAGKLANAYVEFAMAGSVIGIPPE